MAKKFISGENLIYALGKFEQQMQDMVEKITDIAMSSKTDISDMMAEVDKEIEDQKNESN